jgi:hypothetical protein
MLISFFDSSFSTMVHRCERHLASTQARQSRLLDDGLAEDGDKLLGPLQTAGQIRSPRARGGSPLLSTTGPIKKMNQGVSLPRKPRARRLVCFNLSGVRLES